MRTNLLIVLVIVAAISVAVVALLNADPSGTRGPRTGSRYVDGVRAASMIDPALVTWDDSEPPIPIAMESPRGLAVDDRDRIWVIGDRLVTLTAAAEQVLRTDELAGDYRALAIDGRGRVAAAARDRVDLIEVTGPTTRVVRSLAVPGDAVDLSAVAVSTEWIFAADSGGCAVYRAPLEGDDPATFEVLVDGFFVPSTMDLTVSPEDELTTVDPGRHKIQTRDGYGDVVRAFGQRGAELTDFHGCCNPTAIAVTAVGQVVTAEKGLGVTRIKVYDPGGELDSVVAGPDRFDHRPDGPPVLLDLAVDSAGRVLVLDPARKQVRIFTRKPR